MPCSKDSIDNSIFGEGKKKYTCRILYIYNLYKHYISERGRERERKRESEMAAKPNKAPGHNSFKSRSFDRPRPVNSKVLSSEIFVNGSLLVSSLPSPLSSLSLSLYSLSLSPFSLFFSVGGAKKPGHLRLLLAIMCLSLYETLLHNSHSFLELKCEHKVEILVEYLGRTNLEQHAKLNFCYLRIYQC